LKFAVQDLSMHGLAVGTAVSWNNRYNRDSDKRSAARARVEGLMPVTVITGASQGIGLAFARVFRRYGHNLVLIARDSAKLESAKTELEADRRAKGKVLIVACDLTREDAPRILDDNLAGFGCYLDILVNNAAAGLSGPFSDYPADQLDALVALNIAALTRLTRHVLPGMLARGDGGVLNIASLGGVVPGPHQAAYYASKAYVVSLSEALAREVSGYGVRISVVAPGPVATRFHAKMGAQGAPYRLLLPELTPNRVARSGYRGFTLGKRVIVPGILPRLFYVALRLLPHPISVPLTGWLLKNPK
jgi:short-subunit dehydrogenase